MRPLQGIKVVTFEHAIAAPFCTRQLADLGARVIKIERPGTGDFARGYDERVSGLASHFVWTNRSKESITLDVKQPQALDIVHKLLADADVFVQNLAPGATQRLGFDYATLSVKYPKLIVCDISGYGLDGPFRDKKAYDLLIQSESGFLSITGSKGEPAKAGCSIADIAAGMYGYTNILAALLERAQTGRGKHIDVSMLESMVEWMSYPLYYSIDGQTPPRQAGASHATIFPYGPFVAGDGKTVMLGLQNEREWKNFCETVIARPELLTDERFASNSGRAQHREELTRVIVDAFSAWTAAQVIERLEQASIANARMNDMHDVWHHEQLQARQRWTHVQTAAGEIPALYPPGMAAADAPRMDPVPALGAHTDAILRELGFSAAEVDALRASHAV
ncbi:CaiB/BaiF CoA transferase family protein [Paraburkholderia caribensis]|uniref:CaiB/BaiF CoA transferase family protein n=1 Tax=Paraburkholderia caribensis TaxID=75105 RepID=UPI0015900340|nr:CaiB/BaiF CoA-transferase family protein [Paraburkholderia caribensis]